MDFTEPLDFASDSMAEGSGESTPMKDYYRGKTVFLTGGTGFLGQLYVEKLLRCDVKWIYLLARSKKGKSAEERLAETYVGTHFSKLQKKDPNFLRRIRVIEGDLSKVSLGISEEDLKDMFENVEIVLHAAADVRFDEKLYNALMINLRGTNQLLRIAEQMKKLQAFAYISTAYSNCPRLKVDEKFYEPPMDPEVMMGVGEQLTDEKDLHDFEILAPRLINPWPNTYTYSKALTEASVRKFGEKFPICIIRPSVVISTHEDPVPAWCNNIYGLNGVLVANGMGVLRLMPLERSKIGDIVCADFVINSTLAAIWVTHEDAVKSGAAARNPEPEIYHVSTTADRPVLWSQISDQMRDMFAEYPSEKMMWKHCPNSVTSPFWWKYLTIWYHVFPAIFFDCINRLRNNPTRVLGVYRKVQKFMDALKYFMQREWLFTNTNMKRVLARMSPEDQDFFPSDVRRYDWNTFSYNYLLGLRHYIGMEPMNNVEKARTRYRYLVILHNLVLVLYYGVHVLAFSWLAYKIGLYDYAKDNLIYTFEFIKDPK